MSVLTEPSGAIGEDRYCRSEGGKYRYLYSPDKDKKYRYWLEAKLCENPKRNGAVLFIMLNPGTETGKEKRKNHTTRNNCERFTREQGYGTLWTCNLFAFRASKSDVIKCKSHIGENNDSYILRYAQQAEVILCAWGEGKGRSRTKEFRRDRGNSVLQLLKGSGLLPKTYHLRKLTMNDQPRHPMILPENTQPIPILSSIGWLRT